jgi:hypothetical protein
VALGLEKSANLPMDNPAPIRTVIAEFLRSPNCCKAFCSRIQEEKELLEVEFCMTLFCIGLGTRKEIARKAYTM